MRRFPVLPVLLLALAPAARAADPSPVRVTLPSAEPSGFPKNDVIPVVFYPAKGPAPAPAVIVLHPLGEKYISLWKTFAQYLAERGIGAAVFPLPYHMQRKAGGRHPSGRFISTDAATAAQAYSQAVSDVRTVTDWLAREPGVDPNRLGVVGVSLGAIIAHLAMGQDPRLNAGVAALGAGNLPDLYHTSLLFILHRWSGASHLSPAEKDLLRRVDPLTYAGNNHPRRVLMIQAARDDIMPPRDVLALWRALGRPPIQWVDSNHYALTFVAQEVMRTSAAYLRSVWMPGDSGPIPPVRPPTLKIGLASGLDSRVTVALSWQTLSLGSRHHMALLHLDPGLSGRGFFLAGAVTLTSHVDAGLARRFDGHTPRFYLLLHETF